MRRSRLPPGSRGRAHGVELEAEQVDPAPELVDPALELPGFAPQVIQACPQACHGPLDVRHGLDGSAVGRLDLGEKGGAAALNFLLDPQQVSPETVEILAEEGGGGFRGAPYQSGDDPGDRGQPAPPPPRRHSVLTA